MSKKVRVRFAPSPTGFLHIGGVRTALFNYLYAKNQGGKFLLRLEDTDRERFVPEGIEQIKESLAWLGLKPDEVHQQSQRHLEHGVYQKYADRLIKEGLAYYSPTSSSELEKLRQQAKKAKKPFLYKKADDTNNKSSMLKDAPIRLDVDAVVNKLGLSVVKWSEPIGRQLDWQANLIDDFILVKADGYPTYNFANVVDDHEMQITHVMRGDEFIASTPKHILLYKALGLAEPVFVHLPVINGTDGKKLSKRTGDTNVLDYKSKGYLPAALLNFLALLGWNDGTEKEIFTLRELEEKFSLDRINTSPAVFDPKRLDWMNGKYVREFIRPQDLSRQAEGFWPTAASKANAELKQRVLEVAKDRLDYLAQLPEFTSYFFTAPKVNTKEIGDLFKAEKLNPQEWLNKAIGAISAVGSSDRSKLEATLRDAVSQYGPPKALFGSLRIALTGADNTPPIWDIVYALGKEESIKRLEAVKDKL